MAVTAAAPPAPLVEYSKTAFAAAQAENRPIVVFVHASWCVTCRRQQPIVQQLAAGGRSAFSPCVLPLLPLVLAGAVERPRLGPLVLAAGLAASATVVGFAVALLGFALDRDLVRVLAGGLLVLVGLVLLIARLDVAVARAAGPEGHTS